MTCMSALIWYYNDVSVAQDGVEWWGVGVCCLFVGVWGVCWFGCLGIKEGLVIERAALGRDAHLLFSRSGLFVCFLCCLAEN